MSLQDLEKKIYNKDSQNPQNNQAGNFGFQSRPVQDAGAAARQSINPEEKIEGEFVEKRRKARLGRKIFLIAGISAALLFLASSAALYFLLKFKSSFREKDIVFSMEYPQGVTSGKEAEIKIKCGNFSKARLKDASVTLRYPDSFDLIGEEKETLAKDWNIGEIAQGESKTINIPVRIFAAEGSSHYIEGNFQYIPENFNSVFKKSESGKIKVDSLPIRLIMEAPKEIPSGRKIDYRIVCENLVNENFSNLILRINFSSGFVLESIVSEDEEKKIFEDEIVIENLEAYENKVYDIKGVLNGEIGYGQIIKAQAGFKDNGKFRIFDSSEAATLTGEQEIALAQTLKGSQGALSAGWGDIVAFKINVKNNTEIGLSGVKIFAQIEGEVVDFSSSGAQGGVISSGGMVMWDSSGIPEFAYFQSSQEKELFYSVKIKKGITIKNSSMKNFVISSTPGAEAIELKEKILGEKLEVRVRSKLVLNSLGFYYEDGKAQNSGPIPPKVGQTTTYILHWQLINWTNDAAGIKASAVLPPGVGWSNNIGATRGNLYFNNVTRTVFWEIDNIPANTGIISPIYDAAFQVSITPSESDAGKSVKILGRTAIIGTDSFTGENLSFETQEKTTELREDGNLNDDGYRVVY